MAEEVTTPVAQEAVSTQAAAPAEPTQVPTQQAVVGSEGVASTAVEQPKEEAPKEVAPEEYADFVDDNGVGFAAKEMPEFTAMAKELGLPQEKAQKLLMTMIPTVRGKLQTSLNEVKNTWKNAALNDEEYGGEAFSANMKIANVAFAKYVTPELKSLMQRAGLSAHPDFIRMFYRIGKSMSQDTGVTGQGSPQPKRRMFPNSNMAI